MRLYRVAAAAVALATLSPFAFSPAAAGEFPDRAVKIVVPFGAGGSADTLGRVFADQLSTMLKQQFVVENRGGAGGLVASAAVAHADPDGYTYVVSGIASHVIAPATSTNAGFDPMKDFVHVAYFGGPPIVLVAHPSLNVKSIKDLVALGKASKTPLEYVSPGAGTLGNLAAEYWADKVGIKLLHIPYKGAAQATNDLIGGHVKLGSMTFTTASAQIRGNRVIPLAVTSDKRLAEFPDVPTFKELGFPDLVATTWFSLSAPAGVPADIVKTVNGGVNKAMDNPVVQKRLALDAIDTIKMSPEEFTAFVAAETAKWGPVAKAVIKN